MRTNGERRLAALAAGLAIAAAVVGGCGSDDSGSGDGASAATGGSADIAAARETVAQAQRPPEEIGVTTPLPEAAEPGKTFVYLQCDIAQCQSIGEAIRAATDAVGWNYVHINFQQADPSTLISAMKRALDHDPVAVSFSGQPEALWSQMIPVYERAGVAIIPQYVGPAKMDGPVVGNIDGPADLELAADILADWLIVDSGGDAKALVQNVPGFPAIATWAEALRDSVGRKCPDCEVELVDTSVAQLTEGSGSSVMISALQRDRSFEYAMAFNGLFIPGLEAALDNAGLSEVKIAGYVASDDYVASMVDGKDYAFLGLNTDYGGWLAVDMALRYDQGTELDPDEQLLPVQLLTEASATPQDAKSVTDFQRPEGYQEQFEELWNAR